MAMAQDIRETLVRTAYERLAKGEATPEDRLLICLDWMHQEDQKDHAAILTALKPNNNPGPPRKWDRARQAAPPVLSGAGIISILILLLELFRG